MDEKAVSAPGASRLLLFRIIFQTFEEVEQTMAVTPAGEPFVSADQKWTALRRLHERFGVPVDELRPLTSCGAKYFHGKMARQGWKSGVTAQTMLVRLSDAIDRQLLQFQVVEADAFDEKQARALAAMAKTLETITAIEKRLADDSRGNERNRRTDGNGISPDDAGSLEAELSAMVAAMS